MATATRHTTISNPHLTNHDTYRVEQAKARIKLFKGKGLTRAAAVTLAALTLIHVSEAEARNFHGGGFRGGAPRGHYTVRMQPMQPRMYYSAPPAAVYVPAPYLYQAYPPPPPPPAYYSPQPPPYSYTTNPSPPPYYPPTNLPSAPTTDNSGYGTLTRANNQQSEANIVNVKRDSGVIDGIFVSGFPVGHRVKFRILDMGNGTPIGTYYGDSMRKGAKDPTLAFADIPNIPGNVRRIRIFATDTVTGKNAISEDIDVH
jgi:hypothetical protein